MKQLTIENYTILDKIGEGAMSEVYQVQDSTSHKIFSAKILRKYLNSEENNIKRFYDEAHLLESLKDERIVKFHTLTKTNFDQVAIIYEYVEGLNVEEVFTKNEKKANPFFAAALVSEILLGLLEAHRQGIVHRDLKPENILITPEGRIKITDFGIAKSMQSKSITVTGLIVGSPAFMSPEQAMGQTVDEKSDLFSLGGFLFYLSTGRFPFPGETYHEILLALTQHKVVVENINPKIHPALCNIINKALTNDPTLRYQKCYQFYYDIMTYFDQYSIASPTKIIKDFYHGNLSEFDQENEKVYATIIRRANIFIDQKQTGQALDYIKRAETIKPNSEEINLILQKITQTTTSANTSYDKYKKYSLILLLILCLPAIYYHFYTLKNREVVTTTYIPVYPTPIITPPPVVTKAEVPEVKLKPKEIKLEKKGSIFFNIDDDVQVYVNEKKIGNAADTSLKLNVGTYNVTLIKKGFNPISQQVIVLANETTTINAKKL